MSEAVFRAAEQFERLGAEIVEVHAQALSDACLPWLDTCAVDTLVHHKEFYPSRAADYGPVFRAWLEYASRVTAAAYARGEVARQTARALCEKIFTEADCLLCPGMAAPPQSQFRPDQVMTTEDLARLIRFSGPFNYTGSPSITMPNGFTSQGLPTAMQLIGRHGDEATLIRAAAAYERATDWHLRRPPLQVEKG